MMVVSIDHSPRTDDCGLLFSWVNHSFSRGSLRLASSDPEHHPVIEETMLSDSGDLLRLPDAGRRMVNLTRQPSFEDTVERGSLDVRGTPVESLDTGRCKLPGGPPAALLVAFSPVRIEHRDPVGDGRFGHGEAIVETDTVRQTQPD